MLRSERAVGAHCVCLGKHRGCERRHCLAFAEEAHDDGGKVVKNVVVKRVWL